MTDENLFTGEGFTSLNLNKNIPIESDSNIEDQMVTIRQELRELAEKDPADLELGIMLRDIQKKSRLGRRLLGSEYRRIRYEIEKERLPLPPPPYVPSQQEVEKQKAEELAKQQWEEEVNKRAEEISKLPDIISAFQASLKEHKGYIADYKTIGTIIVSHNARLLPKSSGFLFDGASSSGKSDLIILSAEYLPPEDVILVTSCSEQAFNYMGDLSGKYIVGGELKLLKPGEDDAWQQAFRQLITENRITRAVVEKDENGINQLARKVTNGPAVFTMTTTAEATSFNDEFINRLSIAHTDDSELMTEQVLNEQAKSAALVPDPVKERDTALEIEAWRRYYRGIDKLRVVIPFAPQIIPTARTVTTRRLFPMICNYVRALALAHQSNRRGSLERNFMLAEINDYRMAYQLVTANAPKVFDPVAERARKFFQILKTHFPPPTEFIRAQVQQKIKISEAQANRFLRSLKKAGCLSSTEGKTFVYKIESELPATQDFGLVHPDSLLSSTNQPAQPAREQKNSPQDAVCAGSDQLISQNGTQQQNICIDV